MLSKYESVEHQFTSEEIQAAVKHLTTYRRRVIVYRFLQRYSTEETAQLMTRAPDAVRALQHRALHPLRTWLADQVDESLPAVNSAARTRGGLPKRQLALGRSPGAS